MPTYYLSTNVDVIPRHGGVDVTALNGRDSIFVPGLDASLLAELVHGCDRSGIPDAAFTALRQAGALESRPRTDYFGLLKKHLIGPGKPLRKVEDCQVPAPLKPYFHASYALGFGPRFIANQSSLSIGWGADADIRLARIKAAVEGVERYALGSYDLAGFRLAAATELPNRIPVSTEEPLHWQELHSLTGAGSLWAPVDFLHHPVDYNELGRLPVAPLNISGVAAHQSVEAATVNALLELCEHEALMLAWYGRRTTPTIDPASLEAIHREWIRAAESMGWRIILKDVSLGLFPTVMAVGLGPKGKRALTIGSSAAFTSRYAAGKALSEVMRTIIVDKATSPTFEPVGADAVQDVLGHGLYYAVPDHVDEASFLWEGGEMVSATDILTHGPHATLAEAKEAWGEEPAKYELAHVLEAFKGAGIDAYRQEITPPEVQATGIPLFVVRTVAPEMQRMAIGYGVRAEETARWYRLLEGYGHGTAPAQPHPFS